MEAILYEKAKDPASVRCLLCSHRCLIPEGRRGICAVRENRSGVLETLVYGKLIARHVDPIEKKPLFHFLPQSLSYSIATVGCNFRCDFCQNADISQLPAKGDGRILGEDATPEAVVEAALRHHCASISYTYTEPTVYFEFALDTARRAHARGLKNVFVTNGYMTRDALDKIHPYLDAANVDLKAFRDGFYKKQCGARLEPVKASLVHMKSLGIFVEVTTLLIPGLNDDPGQLKDLTAFLVDSLGPETPWHVSRFHPTYRLTDRPVTPIQSLTTARRIGQEAGLKYVYLGNVPGQDGEKTFCPTCKMLLIDRWGFRVERNVLDAGRCPQCQTVIEGVWETSQNSPSR